jgi:uncharacterized membrane protein YedE/YeeE
MLELLQQPWHWSVAGILIGLTVPALLIIGNKQFGISSSLRHVCAMCVPANIPLFKYDWKKEIWNLYFVGGIIIGGFIANYFLANPNPMEIGEATKTALAQYGVSDYSQLQPVELFNMNNVLTIKGLFMFVFGGFLVGFGTRYANGCTSGHAIMGLANLQWPSLVATICFMIGGFLSTHFLLPLFL